MIAIEEVRNALTGSVPTVRTPFDRDGSIDYNALSGMIEFVISAGAKSVVLTAGDSHLMALSDRQVAELTKAVVESVKGRAMVVAADRNFGTRQAIEFARHVKDLGCGMLMLMPPNWAQSPTPATLADHYAAVAREIPVMAVTNVFVPAGKGFGLKTMEQIMSKTDNVLAVKDDMCGDFARELTVLVGERMAVWAGGQKQNHMNMAPYGAVGYLSTFLTFKPDIARQYWNAFSGGDTKGAVDVIREYDMPLFDFISGDTLNGSFDAALHGVLELFGLAERWCPKPYYSLSDGEMEILSDFLKAEGIL